MAKLIDILIGLDEKTIIENGARSWSAGNLLYALEQAREVDEREYRLTENGISLVDPATDLLTPVYLFWHGPYYIVIENYDDGGFVIWGIGMSEAEAIADAYENDMGDKEYFVHRATRELYEYIESHDGENADCYCAKGDEGQYYLFDEFRASFRRH